jgi:hypothetical protein
LSCQEYTVISEARFQNKETTLTGMARPVKPEMYVYWFLPCRHAFSFVCVHTLTQRPLVERFNVKQCVRSHSFCFAQGTAIFFKGRNSLNRAIYVTALWNKNTHFPPKAIEKRFPIIHDCWLILIELLLCDCLYFLPYTTRRVSEIFARLPLQLLKSVSTLSCAFIFQLVVGTFAEAWLRFRLKHLFGEIFEIECVYWAFITFNLPKKHWTHWSGIVSQEQA